MIPFYKRLSFSLCLVSALVLVNPAAHASDNHFFDELETHNQHMQTLPTAALSLEQLIEATQKTLALTDALCNHLKGNTPPTLQEAPFHQITELYHLIEDSYCKIYGRPLLTHGADAPVTSEVEDTDVFLIKSLNQDLLFLEQYLVHVSALIEKTCTPESFSFLGTFRRHMICLQSSLSFYRTVGDILMSQTTKKPAQADPRFSYWMGDGTGYLYKEHMVSFLHLSTLVFLYQVHLQEHPEERR
jgi:hypothetical protein